MAMSLCPMSPCVAAHPTLRPDDDRLRQSDECAEALLSSFVVIHQRFCGRYAVAEHECMAKACMLAVRRSLLLLGCSPRLLSVQLRGSTGSRAPLAALEPQIDTVMTEEAAIRCVANADADCFRLLTAACTQRMGAVLESLP